MEGSGHSDLTGIAVVMLAAMVCGIGLERLRQPAIVGYILAGVLLGPSAFGIVENRAQVDILAELGVLMLLFVVGMELSLRSFRRLWRLAATATVLQIAASTAVTFGLKGLFGWSTGLSMLLGFAVALSSTAVVIKVLGDIGELRTRAGRITVGVLIAQDFAVVPMMLILAAAAGQGFSWLAALKVVVSIGIVGALIWYLSRGHKVRLPFAAVVSRNADLGPLGGLALCFGAAALSGLLGLSAAYGAFIAGLIIGNSQERHAFLSSVTPIQSILMMVFFLSIGLLVDLAYVWANIGTVLMLLFMVSVFKTVLNVGILRLLGQTWPHAFLAAILLAQIGEFSFLLSLIGVGSGLISGEESRLVVAVTVLSLALSPLWVITARRLQTLAARGITSAEEIIRLIYGREVEAVTDTLDGARSKSVIAARRAVTRVRAWRAGHRLPGVLSKARAAVGSTALGASGRIAAKARDGATRAAAAAASAMPPRRAAKGADAADGEAAPPRETDMPPPPNEAGAPPADSAETAPPPETPARRPAKRRARGPSRTGKGRKKPGAADA